MYDVTMPRVDPSMYEGVVLKWLKEEGDAVEEGYPLVLIMSEKVEYEAPSPVSGTIYRILVGKDSEVPVGEPIAIIAQEGDVKEDLEKHIHELVEAIPRPEEKIEEIEARGRYISREEG